MRICNSTLYFQSVIGKNIEIENNTYERKIEKVKSLKYKTGIKMIHFLT